MEENDQVHLIPFDIHEYLVKSFREDPKFAVYTLNWTRRKHMYRDLRAHANDLRLFIEPLLEAYGSYEAMLSLPGIKKKELKRLAWISKNPLIHAIVRYL